MYVVMKSRCRETSESLAWSLLYLHNLLAPTFWRAFGKETSSLHVRDGFRKPVLEFVCRQRSRCGHSACLHMQVIECQENILSALLGSLLWMNECFWFSRNTSGQRRRCEPGKRKNQWEQSGPFPKVSKTGRHPAMSFWAGARRWYV